MGKLANQVAVVTGASKGIGAGIAKALAAEGASVVVNYASSKADGERVVKEIIEKGGKAIAVQADVSKQAGRRQHHQYKLRRQHDPAAEHGGVQRNEGFR